MRLSVLLRLLILFTLITSISRFSVAAAHYTEIPLVRNPEVIIDGVPDEDVWRSGLAISELRDSRTGMRLPLRTEIYIFVSSEGIYWGGRCYQEPSTIRASQSADEQPMYSDDRVVLMIDPNAKGLGKLVFRVNALGAHSSYSTWSVNWIPKWTSSAKTGEEGWSFEAFIPFKVLGLTSGKRLIAINVGRYVSFSGAFLTWIWGVNHANPVSFRKLFVKVSRGIRELTILPQLYSLYDGDLRQLTHGLGLDVNYDTGSYVLSVTLNPSFNETLIRERYLTPLATQRLLGETRPFFRENIRYLQPLRPLFVPTIDIATAYRLLYTRSLTDVSYGVKLTGRFGALEGGVLLLRGVDYSFSAARLLFSRGIHQYALFASSDALAMEYQQISSKENLRVQLADASGSKAGFISYSHDNSSNLAYGLSYVFVSDRFNLDRGYVPMRGLSDLNAYYSIYKVWREGNIRNSVSWKLKLKSFHSWVENSYLPPMSADYLSLIYERGRGSERYKLMLGSANYELSGVHRTVSTWGAQYERFISSNEYLVVAYKLDTFLGEQYDALLGRLSTRVGSNSWVELSYMEVNFHGKVSELGFSFNLSQGGSTYSLSVYVNECGRANLVMKHRGLYDDGSELYLMYGSPAALSTQPLLYVKYIKKISLTF